MATCECPPPPPVSPQLSPIQLASVISGIVRAGTGRGKGGADAREDQVVLRRGDPFRSGLGVGLEGSGI